MSPAQIAILGLIAGVTIFLGLPFGRLRAAVPRLTTALNAVANGILIFLVWDVLTHAWEPIDDALARHQLGDALESGLVLTARSASDCSDWCDSTDSSLAERSSHGGPGAATIGDVAARPGRAPRVGWP